MRTLVRLLRQTLEAGRRDAAADPVDQVGLAELRTGLRPHAGGARLAGSGLESPASVSQWECGS